MKLLNCMHRLSICSMLQFLYLLTNVIVNYGLLASHHDTEWPGHRLMIARKRWSGGKKRVMSWEAKLNEGKKNYTMIIYGGVKVRKKKAKHYWCPLLHDRDVPVCFLSHWVRCTIFFLSFFFLNLKVIDRVKCQTGSYVFNSVTINSLQSTEYWLMSFNSQEEGCSRKHKWNTFTSECKYVWLHKGILFFLSFFCMHLQSLIELFSILEWIWSNQAFLNFYLGAGTKLFPIRHLAIT